MGISAENVYKPSDDVVAREIEGEIIIVPLVAGIGDMEDELFTLNDTGKAIWDNLDGQRSLADVVAALQPEFEEAEDGAIERDVLGLVAELVQRRMLVVT
jgi:hypothetical protein